MKILFAIAALVSALAVPAAAAELRHNVTVSDDNVTLGDLFVDAGNAAHVSVATAPAPGLHTQISVSTISMIARRNGIQWRNTSDITHVNIMRSGVSVPDETIISTIAAAAQAQMSSLASNAKLQVDFTGGTANLQVAEGAEQTVAVHQLAINARSGQFTALVRAPANDAFAPLRRLTGRAYPVQDVPVLNREIAPGDVVREADIDWVRLPSDRVSLNIITSSSQLVGMSPRRPVKMGEALRTADMQAPLVVKKGDFVEVAFVSGALTLSARARALQSGALGDTVDFINPRSNRTLQGVVEGPNRLRVTMPGMAQASAAPNNAS